MALSSLPELLIYTLLAASLYLYFKSWRPRNQLNPMDWPVLGVLPSVVNIAMFHNLHDQLTHILAGSGCNFKAQGPLGSRMRFFITSDPENIQHIFISNHANYPKGEEFAEVFDILRGSIFTVDGEQARQHRGMFKAILSNPQLLALGASSCRDKVVNGLLPFLTHMASTQTAFDLQGLIVRLLFDLTATSIFGVDPEYLQSTSMLPPMDDVATAMDTIMEVGLLRQTMPASLWKVMRWLNIGPERKMARAHTMLHGFVRDMVEKTKGLRSIDALDKKVAGVDIILSGAYPAYKDDNNFLLRATLINYMFASRDTVGTTLSWVFYNLAMNPRIISGIRNELAPIMSLKASASVVPNGTNPMLGLEPEEMKDLVYLQAVLFETLRLYPPGPIERKMVLADDVLPSGHRLCSGETILVSLYAMGRMEALWGNDCHEYRPERWLSDEGAKLRHVPSHKFMAFNTGPRMCPGKDISIVQMKTIVAAVVWNFDMEVLEGQSIEPKLSCILQMKNGLMVMVKKRGI